MKKALFAALAAAVLTAGLLAGCASGSDQPSDDKIEVVCATFPAYDWAREVIGDESDRFELTYLMGSGTDLHSYQPSVEDIAKIKEADLFIYVGGESDEWAADAIAEADADALHTVNMLETVGDGAVEEETVEGMQPEDEHEHEHEGEAEEEHEGEEGPEYDEHVWLSLTNAQTLVNAIAAELAAVDPDNADAYTANAEAYNAELAALDQRYAQAVEAGAKDTVLFGDRFPFRYLVDDYGLNYYAAFVGCSAETEASFETVAFLANKVDELGLGCVLVIENSDESIAQTVVDTSQAKSAQILVMDSLQSVLQEDADGGKTYLSAMEANLEVLTTALS